MDFFEICQREYGINDSVTSAIRWARLSDPTPPRKIGTEKEYVRECRRLCRRLDSDLGDDLGGIDFRLIAAGFQRVPPREWILGDRRDCREPRLLSDFIAWWIATQARPGVVGSCYNAYPGDAFALWQAGITPKRAKLVPPAHWSRLVRHGKVIRRNLLDAAHIGRALRRAWAAPYPLGYNDPDRGDVGTNTLALLGRMEPEYQRIALRGALSRRIERAGYGPVRPQDLDWGGVAAARAQLNTAPVEALRDARCPTRHFLRWSENSIRGREIRSIIALRERGWRIFVSNCRQYEEQEHPLVVALWERILAAGCANHPTLIKHAQDLAYNPGALSAALAAGHVPDPKMSWHQILEWLDSLGHSSGAPGDVGQDRSAQHHLRALDRLAQRDPEEAIRSYRAEYERGRRLGDLLRQVLACLRTQADEGATLVVHGRDGELIHELCRRSGIPTRYAITSRPLTTQRSSISAEYDQYLRATVPDRAVHVDTGFAGSIPRWLGGRGWIVAKIMMVSANVAEDRMPIEGISASSLREIVLADLEHSAQRLECPRSWPPRYSHEAMGFWARVYGACDEIGLPRQMGSRREVAS